MLILLGMLLIGLFAASWGFTMCFFPAQWGRLTEAIGGPSPRWMYPGPKSLAPIMKLGSRAVGMVICIAGCWFACVAVTEIYRVLAR